MRMKHLAELVAHHLQQHDASNGLETAARTSGTSTDKHTYGENNPCDVRPFGCVVVEESRSGKERYYLIDAATEGVLVVVAIACDEHHHDEQCEDEGDADVEFHFYIIDEILHFALDDSAVEKDEVKSGEEAEQCADILHCWRIECLDAIVVRSKSASCESRHSVVYAIEHVHSEEVIAYSAGNGKTKEYDPD